MRYSTVSLEAKGCRRKFPRTFLVECKPPLAIHCTFLRRMKEKRRLETSLVSLFPHFSFISMTWNFPRTAPYLDFS